MFVLLAATHVVVSGGCFLVARFAILAGVAVVSVSNIEAMGPAVVHVLEELGGWMLGPEVAALLSELLATELVSWDRVG